MIELSSVQFSMFVAAAVLLAITPGPGLAYVVARTAAGGRSEGLASTFGTSVGGLVHVVAGALGLSLIVAESALLFSVLKYLGAAYLIYLGLKLYLSRPEQQLDHAPRVRRIGSVRAFWEGVAVEALNVKTALFFLAFIPQFIDPAQSAFWQFLILGTLCAVLNSLADVVVVFASAGLIAGLRRRRGPAGLMRRVSGCTLVGLGVFLALTEPRR